MTQTNEFNASTVEEALQKASASLGVPADDLSYEVLDEGSEGFLGIGARDARIAVRAPDADGATDGPDQEASYSQEPAIVEVDAAEQIEATDTQVAPDLAEIYGESDETEDVAASEELLGEIRELVTSVVSAMGFAARIDVYDPDGLLAVDDASDSKAIIICQKG